MQTTKKVLSVLLAVLMLALSVPFVSFAEGETSGTWGTDGTWSFADGTLTVNGTGATDEYNTTGQTSPWQEFKKSITKVVVGEGVTQLSKQFMYKGTALKTVELPESMSVIGRQAFLGCTKLETINFPNGLTKIVNLAFDQCPNLKATYPGTAKDWDEKVTMASDAGIDSNVEFHIHEYKLAGDNAFVWSGSDKAGYTASKVSFVCECGATKDVTDISVASETVDATCEKTGLTVYTATPVVADETYGDDETVIATYVEPYTDTKEVTLPALGHSVTKVDKVDKTCEAAGNIEYWVCSRCNKLFSDEAATAEIQQADTVVPASHAFSEKSKVEAKTPDCIHDGNIAYWVCDDCGRFFADNQGKSELTEAQTVIPATGEHAYGAPVWTWNDDKTEASATFTCTVEGCGDQQVKEADVTLNDKREPTCGADGYYQNKATALFLNNNYEATAEQVVIPATGKHTYGDPTWTWNYDTEDVTATATFKCTVCGDEQNVVATSIEKSSKTEDNKQSSCTEEGFYVLVATVNFVQTPGAAAKAFNSNSKQIAIPLKKHTLEKTEAQDASCTEEGNIDYWTCSECNQLFNDEEGKNVVTADDVKTPATGHQLVKTEATPKTCKTEGNKAYWTCSVCKKIFSDPDGKTEATAEELVIPAGHELVKTEAKEATCTENGNLAYWTCSVCNHIYLDENAEQETTANAVVVPAGNHDLVFTDKVDPTCETAGNIAYWTCSVCNKMFSDAEAKTETTAEAVILAKLNHNITTVEFRQNENDGFWYAVATCSRHLDRPVLVKATWVTKTAATCGTKEKGVYSATVNDKVYTSDLMEIGETLEHNYQFDSFVWAADNKTAQAKLVCSNDNSHTQLVEAEMSHQTVQPTCQAEGYTIYTASYKGQTAEGAKVDITEKLAHNFTGDIVNKSNGTHTRKCTMCATESDPVACSFNAWAENPEKKATCTEAGEEIRTCTVCGYKETRTKAALGHDWGEGQPSYRRLEDNQVEASRYCYRCKQTFTETKAAEWVVTKEPTHTTKGEKVLKVIFDNKDLGEYVIETQEIPETEAHNWTFVNFTWTKTDDGYTAVANFKCKDHANETKTETATVSSETTDATCEEDGKIVYTATYGDNTDTRDETINATGHTYGAPAWSWNDDNTAATATFTCTACDETVANHTKQLPATVAASTEAADTQAATCTADGFHYNLATVTLGEQEYTNKSAQITDAKLGHSFTKYVSNNDATCTEDGTKTAKCDRCDATDTIADTGSKLGHSFTKYVSNNDATCTEDGTKTAKCDRCDATDTIADEGTKLGHSFTNYVSNNDATCTKDGTKTAKCDRCDATNTIDDAGTKLGHSFTKYVSNNDATCTKDGTKTAKCDRCDETDTIADSGSALGHDYQFVSFAWAEDNKTATVNLVCSHDNTHTSLAAATMKAVKTPATCDDDAYTTYTATYGENVDSRTVISEGSATGHDWGAWQYLDANNHIRYCNNDAKHFETEEHDVDSRTENYVDSTYTKEGHYDVVWYCVDCGRELARETYPIDVIAHEHDYREIYRVDANCSELGTVYYQCKLCGATTEDSIPKNDVHADVNNDGICDRCGKQPMPGEGRCPQCGRIHNAGFFDRITGVFHRISYFFSHLFTR